jgi:hypothetical protein
VRRLRPTVALLAALVAFVAALGHGAVPARAAGSTTVTVLSPSAEQTVSGSVRVRFRVEVAAGSTGQSYYQVRLGRWLGPQVFSSCTSTCELEATVDTAASRFPSPRYAWSGGQVDDGPQTIRVDSLDISRTVLGYGTRGVVVDNDRPTLTVSGPAAPTGASDGRVTVNQRLRLEVHPTATAEGADVTDVRAASGLSLLSTATRPASPGAPWVLDLDASEWGEGPRDLDVVTTDSRGMVSAPEPFAVMVVRSMRLSGPSLPSPVVDDELTSLDLRFSYSQFVKDTWPVQVDTLVDGTLSNRQAIPSNERTNDTIFSVGPGAVVPTGTHVLRFVVTDNRGFVDHLDIPVDVRSSTTLAWASGTGQQSPVGRPMSLSVKASTQLGSISYWVLENASTGEVLVNDVCATPCGASTTRTLTFTPTRQGTLNLRLRMGLQPSPRLERVLTTSVTALPALNDFSGDGKPDVLARTKSGAMMLYRGNGKGGWAAPGTTIGTGWQSFSAIVSNGDLDGDFRRDVLGRGHASQMYLYRGNGMGGWTGRGEPLSLVLPGYTIVSGLGDFDGDARTDLVARDTGGRLFLYRGRDGLSKRTQIGSGWQGFTALFSTGDFDGDRRADVLGRTADGRLVLYRGNGKGGWAAPGKVIGSGWGGFTALTGIGDFDGDRRADVLARTKSGALMLYRGNGAGGWAARGYAVGSGWGGFTAIVGVG